MKKKPSLLLGTIALLLITGCNNPTSPSGNGEIALGDVKVVSVGSETLNMIYAQNKTSISFPAGMDNSGTATLTVKFFIGETEVTNAVIAAVFQWAYDNDKFSTTVGDHNGLDTNTAKHGDKQLLDLDNTDCRVAYDGSASFSADAGYENNPGTYVSWYGSIMFCNWLTEMRDGNTNNVVYTGIDTNWEDDETVEDISKNGYRLPSSDEWEYTARYRNDNINVYDEATYSNPYFTMGNSASGAIDNYNNASASQAVAVYDYTDPNPYNDEQVVKSLGTDSVNSLGIYDMSGNISEWCFTENGTGRMGQGGDWGHTKYYLQIGFGVNNNPGNMSNYLGFRLCRTTD